MTNFLRAVSTIMIAGIGGLSTSSPAVAGPDGKTSTLEITGGASAVYYATQAIRVNVQSKRARSDAESQYRRHDYFVRDASGLSQYKIVEYTENATAANSQQPKTLYDLRGYILDVVANDSSLRLTSIPQTIDTSNAGIVKRNAFEIVRGCWNEYTTTATVVPATPTTPGNNDKPAAGDAAPAAKPDQKKPGGGKKPGAMAVSFAAYVTQAPPGTNPAPVPPVPPVQAPPNNALGGAKLDCLQPLNATGFDNHADYKNLFKLLDVDVLDTANAFSSAPSLAQQIVNLQVGGNDVENQERAAVLAALCVLFLDLYPENGPHTHRVAIVDRTGSIVFPKPAGLHAAAAAAQAGSTDVASTLTSFGQGCFFGSPSISSCQTSLSSLESQLTSGIAKADVCAFQQLVFMPTYQRIARNEGSTSTNYNSLAYGQPPGC